MKNRNIICVVFIFSFLSGLLFTPFKHSLMKDTKVVEDNFEGLNTAAHVFDWESNTPGLSGDDDSKRLIALSKTNVKIWNFIDNSPSSSTRYCDFEPDYMIYITSNSAGGGWDTWTLDSFSWSYNGGTEYTESFDEHANDDFDFGEPGINNDHGICVINLNDHSSGGANAYSEDLCRLVVKTHREYVDYGPVEYNDINSFIASSLDQYWEYGSGSLYQAFRSIFYDRPLSSMSKLGGSLGSSGWYTDTANLRYKITANDFATDDAYGYSPYAGVATIYYKEGSGSWDSHSCGDPPFEMEQYFSTEGVTDITYYCRDRQGYDEQYTNTDSFKIDTQNPNSVIDSITGTHGNGTWYIDDVTIELSATDSTSGVNEIVYRKVEDGIHQSWVHDPGLQATVTINYEGTTYLEYYAVDNAGNSETTNTSPGIVIDKSHVQLKWGTPSNNTQIIFPASSHIYFNFSYVYGDINRVDLYVNNGTEITPCGNVWDLSGEYQYEIINYDNRFDGYITAYLVGYWNDVQLANVSRNFFFSKITSNVDYILDSNTTIIGNHLHMILYDPSGDDSTSKFSSGSTMSMGIGCSVTNGISGQLEVGVDFGLCGIGFGASASLEKKQTTMVGYDFRYEISTLSSLSSSTSSNDPDYIGPGYGDIFWGEAWWFRWELRNYVRTYYNGTVHNNTMLFYGINRTGEAFYPASAPNLPDEWANQSVLYNNYQDVSFFRTVLVKGSPEIMEGEQISTLEARTKKIMIEVSKSAQASIGYSFFSMGGKIEITMQEQNYEEESVGQWIATDYNIHDNEGSDQLSMDIGRDPVFGTYVFRTHYDTTETSNPLEHGTIDYVPPEIPLESLNVNYDTNGDGLEKTEDDEVDISIDIIDEGMIMDAFINFSTNAGNNWDTRPLIEQVGNPGTWQGTIPVQEHGTTVLWSLYAFDENHFTIRRDENDNFFSYTVINRDPEITITSPNGGEVISGPFLLTWNANDSDDDVLSYDLFYNVENTGWHLIVAGVTNTQYDWDLSGISDSNSVYIQVIAHDGFGGESSDTNDYAFSVYTTLPWGSIEINNGDVYTTSTLVALDITCSTATEMCFSNDNQTWSLWETYTSLKDYVLIDIDGVKTVYIKFKDQNDLISFVFYDDIILDTELPTGSLSINDDDSYTTNIGVSLTIEGIDVNGISQMRFSYDKMLWTDWETYATTKSFNLYNNDGEQTVYVQFKDGVGRTSSVSINDSIILDRIPPTGTILINNGEVSTTSTQVMLNLTASDANDVIEMKFSTDGVEWTEWEPFSNTKLFTFSSELGEKMIFVKYKDSAGLESEITIFDTILLVSPKTDQLAVPGYSLIIVIGIVSIGIVSYFRKYLRKKSIK
ncbi:MAG: OmpL47-type beta-barrel domain-containing protein [Promethearchaeota archaeon]